MLEGLEGGIKGMLSESEVSLDVRKQLVQETGLIVDIFLNLISSSEDSEEHPLFSNRLFHGHWLQ